MNPAKSHLVGTDLFNLVRTDGKWLIASVADTGRKDCSVR